MSPVHLSLTVRVCLKYKTNVSIFLRNISLSKSLVSALYSKLYQDLVHYGVLKWKNELIKLKIISLSENFFSVCLCLLLYEAPFILHCNHDHYGFLNWKNELIKTILHRARMNLVHCHQQHPQVCPQSQEVQHQHHRRYLLHPRIWEGLRSLNPLNKNLR